MKLRERTLPSGKRVWVLDHGKVNGRRKQEIIKGGKAEADRAFAKAEKARRDFGKVGIRLTTSEIADALLAKEKLGAVTLVEAADFYLKHANRIRERVLVPELVKRFIDAKDAANRSKRYLRQLGVSLGSLALKYPLKRADELTRADIEGWVTPNQWSAKTVNNYLGDVSALFNWASAPSRGFAARNPTEDIERETLGDEEIGTLTVAQCKALLEAALNDGAMLAYVVLGLFGGIRAAEIERLTWDKINLTEKTVVIEGRKAKTRQRRVVDLPANAVAWLKLMQAREGKVCARAHAEHWREFRKRLGYAIDEAATSGEPWPHNALRHTFASMHFAMHQNESLLQALMGHESAAMLHRHYKALKTKAEARKFYELRPAPGVAVAFLPRKAYTVRQAS